MKSFTVLLAAFSFYASIAAAPHHRGKNQQGGANTQQGGATNTATGGATNNAAAGGAVTRGSSTLVLKEVGGVPGNKCLTFRNNGMYIVSRAELKKCTCL